MAKILVVDDEKDIRDLVSDILDEEGNECDSVGHAQSAIDHVDSHGYDLVILDIWLKESQMDGIDILKYIKNRHPQLPVVIISGHGNVEIAVAAVKQGAFDFIEKPFNLDQLLVVINRALETSKLRRIANKNTNGATHIDQEIMIGESPAMKNLKSQIDKLGKTQSRVMFKGPSGSGKELAARVLHMNSSRAQDPFIVVNSAMLNSEDLERQLFGYEEGGVFQIGILERAGGGTIFFDEIADMPIETQGKILRIINDQSFERVGSGKQVSVDIRFCSATKEDLGALMKEGKFREELYHRLNVVSVEIPSLKSRSEDIEALGNHFAAHFSRRDGIPERKLSAEAVETLQAMPWPGNVRELRNRIESALIFAQEKDRLTADDFMSKLAENEDEDISTEYLFLPLREARELFEQRYLSFQIERFSGNISRTANFIGMERSALHRKLKSLNVSGQARKNG